MKILDSLIGKRKSDPLHRTVDGGHPAPYPDMTDEQLYNYEATFNVANKTFDKRPPPNLPIKEESTRRDEDDTGSPEVLSQEDEETPREQVTSNGQRDALDFTKSVR